MCPNNTPNWLYYLRVTDDVQRTVDRPGVIQVGKTSRSTPVRLPTSWQVVRVTEGRTTDVYVPFLPSCLPPDLIFPSTTFRWLVKMDRLYTLPVLSRSPCSCPRPPWVRHCAFVRDWRGPSPGQTDRCPSGDLPPRRSVVKAVWRSDGSRVDDTKLTKIKTKEKHYFIYLKDNKRL